MIYRIKDFLPFWCSNKPLSLHLKYRCKNNYKTTTKYLFGVAKKQKRFCVLLIRHSSLFTIAYIITLLISTFKFLPRKTQRTIFFFHDAISLFMKEKRRGLTALLHGVERYVTGLQMHPWGVKTWTFQEFRLLLLQESSDADAVGNWISMHACARKTPNGRYIRLPNMNLFHCNYALLSTLNAACALRP